MTTPHEWSDAETRRATAWHEAGHAVAAEVLGLPVRYATLRPYGGGGRVLHTGAIPKSWDWRDAGGVCLAGIAAEQMFHTDRAELVDGGRYDLHDARDAARNAIAWRDAPAEVLRSRKLAHRRCAGWRDAAKAMDPGWSEWDVGALMWRRAVDTVTEHLDAVASVAGLLLTSRRAVPGRRIREVLAGSERVAEPPAVGDVEWWIPRHTRMQWRGAA